MSNTRWMDGWDYCDTARQRVAFIGGTVPLVTAAAGRRGTNGITGNASDAFAAYGASGVGPVAYAGVAVQHVSPSGWGKVLGLGAYLNGGHEHLAVVSRDDGSLAVYAGSGVGLGYGTLIGLSDPGIIVPDTFQYIEAGVALDGSDGWIEIRVATATVFRITGIATLASGIDASADVAWLYPLDGRRRYDDLYINASGGGFAGNVRITARFPDGDDTIAWVRNTGTTNYQTVFDRVPDEDVTYNQAEEPAGEPTDLFDVQDLSDRRAGILAIEVISRQRMDGGGTGTLRHVIKGADFPTTVLDGVITVVSGWAYGSTILNTLPISLSGWSDEGFDQAKFGYRRIT